MKWFAIRDAYFGTVVILVQLTSWWPLSVFRTSLVTALQRLSYHFSRSKRSHMERALKRAFGTGLTRQQQQQIIYAAFREFWQDVFAWSPTMTERALVKTAVIHGRQHLD